MSASKFFTEYLLIPLLIYLLAINIVTFLAFGIDKRKAKKGRYRISESALLGMSLAGGAVGGLLAMRLFRHKTLHKRFSIGLPLMLALHCVLCAVIVWFVVLK